MALLLHDSGLRVMECLGLRVKDIDFTIHEVLARDGGGNKDRVPVCPHPMVSKLKAHLERVRSLHHAADLAAGFGRVLPGPMALAPKYHNADRESVAAGVSGEHNRAEPTRWAMPAPSTARGPAATARPGRAAARRHPQARRPAYAPLLRDVSTG